MKAGSPVLYPQVSRLPSDGSQVNQQRGQDVGQKGEFDALLQKSSLNGAEKSGQSSKVDLQQLQQPLKVSAHAAQRLQERSIQLDNDMMSRMKTAIDQADAKGLVETLVLTDKAAMIVSVPNRTIITAMDRENLRGNVFTNIDGAVII